MPRTPTVPDALRGRIFRGRDIVARGLLTRAQLRSSAWRQVRRGIYVDARVPVDHGLAVAAAAMILPKGGLIAGRSAAWLYGVHQTAADDPVDVLVPAEFARWALAGISVHAEQIPPADVGTLAKRRVTTCPRACIDIARWHDVIVAVCDNRRDAGEPAGHRARRAGAAWQRHVLRPRPGTAHAGPV